MGQPTTGISEDLRNFFDAEFANDRAMRAESQTRGADDMDPDDEGFVPDPTLASALDSWRQAPDDIQADFLGLPAGLTPEQVSARVAAAEADLVNLIAVHGEETALTALI